MRLPNRALNLSTVPMMPGETRSPQSREPYPEVGFSHRTSTV
ncbi:hypothetical protein [Sphaerothrix gracilis]